VLSASARSGDTAAIDFLLSRGADINAMDEVKSSYSGRIQGNAVSDVWGTFRDEG
jgi:hypothetical protein